MGVALAVITVGALGFVAGIYYYGSRPVTTSQVTANPVLGCGGSMQCINKVFNENAEKYYPSIEIPQASQSTGVDLVGTVTKFTPLPKGDAFTVTYDVSVKVENKGTEPATRTFNIGMYFSPVKDRVPDGARDYTGLNSIEKLNLGSTSVSGLAAGASTTVNFKTVKRCGGGGSAGLMELSPIAYLYPVVWVDNANAVAETNESNNISSGKVFSCIGG